MNIDDLRMKQKGRCSRQINQAPIWDNRRCFGESGQIFIPADFLVMDIEVNDEVTLTQG